MTHSVELPIRLGRGQNDREHWYARAKRVKKEKKDTHWALIASGAAIPALPCVVTITRVAPTAVQQPLDTDNLAGSAKATRDSIATWMGIDDGDDRVTWKYAQAPGPWAVLVSFEDAA